MDSANVRNLEQIQEDDTRRRGSRLGALLLASIAGALLVIVGIMTVKRGGTAQKSAKDPLAALVASSRSDSDPPEKLDGRDVTFPGILSDDQAPTTALAAVKDERGRLVKQDGEPAEPGSLPAPPSAGDRLPVVPLPAGTLLGATPVTTDPKDSLTALAKSTTQPDPSGELAPAGMDGGYQIQVASFKQQEDADKFVEDLRKRGHSAFRQAAYVEDRGLWHRVRIGPFKSKFQAIQYANKFEKSERVSPFVIDPHKQKLADELKEARREARRKKYGQE